MQRVHKASTGPQGPKSPKSDQQKAPRSKKAQQGTQNHKRQKKKTKEVVEVTVDDISISQIHPVLDHRNQTLEQPNAFQINTSIQRCLAKAIALHGLGLYIFRGEDLPESDPLSEKQLDTMDSYLRQIDDDAFSELVNSRIDSNSINQGNFSTAVAKLESKLNSIKEVTNE